MPPDDTANAQKPEPTGHPSDASNDSAGEQPDPDKDALFEQLMARLEQMTPESIAIPLSIAVLKRLRRLWGLVTGGPYVHIRFPEDETFYQVLRKLLIDHLALDIRFRDVLALAHSTLPDELPTSDVLIAFDEDIQAFHERDFQRLHTALIQCALNHDLDLEQPDIDVLLASHDYYLMQIEKEAKRVNQQWAQKYRLLPEKPTPDSTENGKPPNSNDQKKRGGRKRIDITYELAQRTYWSLVEDNIGSTAPVTCQEMCDRLLDRHGIRLSAETFGNRVKEWAAKEQSWPPPKLDDDFDIED